MLAVAHVSFRSLLASSFTLLGLGLPSGCISPDADVLTPTSLPAILLQGDSPDAVILPDFSYAGYGFGVTEIPTDPGTVFQAADYGVVANDGIDDSKSLLRALEAAAIQPGHVTVLLPPGRVQISEVIPLDRSNLVLKGAGQNEGGSELYFPRPLKIVDTSTRQDELRDYLVREQKIERAPDQNINYLFSEYSWSGGFLLVGPKDDRPVSYDSSQDQRDPVITDVISGKQFEKTVLVRSTDNLKPGQVIQLQWFSEDGEQSEILKSLYGDLDDWNAAQSENSLRLDIGSHHWAFPNRPVVSQATRIVSVEGNTIHLGDPLLHSISEGQPAIIADWQHLSHVGIEDMKLTFPMSPWFGHHLEQGYNAIYLTGVFDGWVKNVTIENADSGILTDNAASLTIDNVVTTGEHKAHYSVHVGAVHNVLVRDLQVQNPVVHPLSLNTRATRSVYLRATVARGAILDQHSGSNHQNLFDNLTLHLSARPDVGGRWAAPLWVGGGAGYWKPGHGLYNTAWNVRLVFDPGPPKGESILVTSGLEGPGARIIGMHGNQPIEIDYRPTAYIEGTNGPVTAAPSLYEFQLLQRK